jgi:hypothetical protein
VDRELSKDPLPFVEELLSEADIQVRLDCTVLESRLLDNLRDEYLYGTKESIRTERTCIMQGLNRLALEHLSRSFNDLCRVQHR